MTRNVLIALILIVLAAVFLIVNRGTVEFNFIIDQAKVWASAVYLCFVVVGVVIGALLK